MGIRPSDFGGHPRDVVVRHRYGPECSRLVDSGLVGGESVIRDPDWSSLRSWSGSRYKGFEELCCQLARFETPPGSEFVRKGSPDGGVECFSRFQDGSEWGWQAKFFRGPLGEDQFRQLDRSVRAALESHPSLVRYFVCVPRDRSDGRQPGVTTEMQRWENRVSKWRGWAHDRAMTVQFVWWGSSELLSRLSQEGQAGRFQFWFGDPGRFTSEWFDKHLQCAVQVAGPRYTPEIHIDVPLVTDFNLFGRLEPAVMEAHRLARKIRRADGSHAIVEALSGMRCHPHGKWPLSDIKADIRNDLLQLDERRDELGAKFDALDASNDQIDSDSAGYRGYEYRDYLCNEAADINYYREKLLEAVEGLGELERVVNSDLMIVMGEAGAGKTHLLCNVARRRLDERRPTVLLMGHQFTTTEHPWVQARSLLGLGEDLSMDKFVGALEAAAEATGSRALFMIDAVNEGEGRRIWPRHLADFLFRLKTSPWIGVVLSVRSTYIDHIVPAEVRESAHVVTHKGFAGDTHAAVEQFCEHYGLDFPVMPLLNPEFDNPLFLKTLCQGLHHSQQTRIPAGSEGISTVFDRYLNAIDEILAGLLDYDPQAGIVAKALDKIAEALADKGARQLPRNEIKEIIDPLVPLSGFSRSLYRALIDNGLLTELPDTGHNGGWHVCFGYEWFADYLIAGHIISRCNGVDDLASALTGGRIDGRQGGWTPWSAPMEALSVLLPERLGIELPEIFDDRALDSHISTADSDARRAFLKARAGGGGCAVASADSDARRAFLKGLPWRDPATIGAGCRALIDDMINGLLDAATQDPAVLEIFDPLVTCAIVPGHPLGSAFLDERLRDLEMPDRDAVWARYLYLTYGTDGPLDRLLDWAEKRPRPAAGIDHETAETCTTILAWCLTTSHRFVRDRATKGLVALLADNIALTRDLILRFDGVNDPYVRERVMAAAYGVAMRNTDARTVAPLADLVHRLIFADGEPPAHVLLRDYAHGIIERALHLGAEIAVDAKLIEPTRLSEWPCIPNASEAAGLKPVDQDRETGPPEDEKARLRIYDSVMNWNSALHEIGVYFTSESGEWPPIPSTESSESPPTPSSESSESPPTPSTGPSWWSEDEMVGYFRRYEELLNQTIGEGGQGEAREDLKANRDEDTSGLPDTMIRYHILWRVFDLGWTVERFGNIDKTIDNSNCPTTDDVWDSPGSEKPEHIGKKYQWIAYHEILAYISDHYQYRVSLGDLRSRNERKRAHQLRVRDIDPSASLTGASPDRGRIENSVRWHHHEVKIASTDDLTHEQWLLSKSDISDLKAQLYFTDSEDGSTWIRLHGHNRWESPTPPGYEPWEIDSRQIWLEACGYLIEATDVEEFIAWSKTVDLSDNYATHDLTVLGKMLRRIERSKIADLSACWMPEPPAISSLFFGELGWSSASEILLEDSSESQHPAHHEDKKCPIPLRPTAFHTTNSPHDCSVAKNYKLYCPHPHMIHAMNLHWAGRGADFADTEGVLAAFDPSAHDTCPPALLVREKNLAHFLKRTGSALAWTITGEKRVTIYEHFPFLGKHWGSLKLTGAFIYEPNHPVGHISTHHIPPVSGGLIG